MSAKWPFIHAVDIESLYTSIHQKSCLVSPSPDSKVVIPTALAHVVISKKALKHVFYMEEIKRKTNSVKHKALGGYHLISEEVNDRGKVLRSSLETIAPKVYEGFILNTTEHLPVYKTFFWGITDRETIQCFRESLQNIEKVEDQGTVWLLEGKSTTYPIQITSIVTKHTLELKTFFPTSDRSKDSIKAFEKGPRIYIKYYFNPCYSVPAADNSDVISLYNYFGSDGIDAQLKFVHLDAKSIDGYLFFGVHKEDMNYLQTPDMKYGLLPDSIVKTLSRDFNNVHKAYRQQRFAIQRYLQWYDKKVSSCHKRLARRLQRQFARQRIYLMESLRKCSIVDSLPPRKVEVLRTIDKINLPTETIQRVLFDGARGFPNCLTKYQILDKLKEAISNFLQLMREDFQETKETDWEDIDLSKWSRPTKQDRDDHFFCPSWMPIERDPKATDTEWDCFGGPVDPPANPVFPHNKYALEMMHLRLSSCHTFSLNDVEDIPLVLPIPDIMTLSPEQQIVIPHLFSNGTCFMDTWEFSVRLDLLSGDIVEFQMPLGHTIKSSCTAERLQKFIK
eukprot:gene14090-15575_t